MPSSSDTAATQIEVKLIPPKYFVAFAFVLLLIGTEDVSHACIDTSPRIYFHFRIRHSEGD